MTEAPCFPMTLTTTKPTGGLDIPYTMTHEQELHLRIIKDQFSQDVDAKYRGGVREHGGNLWEKSPLELTEEAMKEAVDQYVYLATLRGQLLTAIAAGHLPNRIQPT